MVRRLAPIALVAVVLAFVGTPDRCHGAIDNVPAPLGAPSPQQHAVRVMAAGDSITWGDQGVLSYRGALAARTMHRFDWVGPFLDTRGRHAAWPGWTSGELAQSLPGWIHEHQPDVVLLLIGTNDVGYRVPTGCSLRAMAVIIGAARRAGAWVFVSEILPRWQRDPGDGFRIEQLNAAFETFASRGDCFVRWVPQPGFAERHTVDGVHPNAEGEHRIAANFLRAIDMTRCPNRVFE